MLRPRACAMRLSPCSFGGPACAPLALTVGAALGEEDRARLELLTRYLAAAALRRKWRFVLSIYLPGQPPIDAAPIAARLGVPSPEEGYGRPCLRAAAELLRRGEPFPYNYESSWTAAADHILEDVRVQARQEDLVPRLDTEALLRVDEEDFRRKLDLAHI